MAFPIIPKKRSGSAGNPASLQLGELATNTATGELFLGGDGGVMLLNAPSAAGTTVTEHTGDGTTVAFTFTGYSSTDDGAYLVSVGGIDQPPSKYSISSTAGGTLTFVEAPVAGELISIRAIVASGGGGGSGDATSIQGVPVADTAPTNGQGLIYNSTSNQWEPTSLNGSVNFNTPGTHSWAVPAWVRWVYVSATAGNGSNGTATNGQDGQVGINATNDPQAPTTGANGANGTATPGAEGKSISIAALSFAVAGGTAGEAGLPGFGGGGSGGGGGFGYWAAPGADGLHDGNGGYGRGGGAATSMGFGFGGAAGGDGATAGQDGNNSGGGGTGATLGGDGGAAGNGLDYTGGGGGGGITRAGGGGGGGGYYGGSTTGDPGQPGKGGIADTSMCAGGTGESFAGPKDLSASAGTNISIVISEGAGSASITITW